MFSIALYPYVMLVCMICMIASAVHIGNNRVLAKTSRRWFTVSAALLALASGLEAACVMMNGAAGTSWFRILLTGMILVEQLSSSLLILVYCYACDLDIKMKRTSMILIAVNALLQIFMMLNKSSFYIDVDGFYQIGRLAGVTWGFGLLLAAFCLFIFYRLSHRFSNRNLRTLIMCALLQLIGAISSAVGEHDGLCILSYCFSLLLLYSYYEDLMQQEQQEKLIEQNVRIRSLSEQLIQGLTNAVDIKDKYTNGHSGRVAAYSVILARELGWNEEQLKELEWEALLHDIGKIGIPDSVLNKAGRLSNIEFDMIKAHTVLGSEIVPKTPELPNAGSAARSHHERFDGRGYPDKLKGKEIPETARIICLADSYDAMNSDRIYRAALPKEVIRSELVKGAGSQFDPQLAEVFIRLFDEGKLNTLDQPARQDAAEPAAPNDLAGESEELIRVYREHGTGSEEWKKAYRCLKQSADEKKAALDIALITIRPKDSDNLPEGKQAEAIDALLRALKYILDPADTFEQAAEGEVLVILRKNENTAAEKLARAFLYFYKIYDTAPFDIDYRMLKDGQEAQDHK